MFRGPALLATLTLAATGCATVPGEVVVEPGLATPPVVTRAASETGTRCDNPQGFSVSYPAGWSANPGTVVEPCTLFGPQPFRVGTGPTLRAAPIRAAVEPIGFAAVASTRPGERERAGTVIAGRRAVRIVRSATDQDLWPTGTTVISYFVDLGGQPPVVGNTLVLDLVGLSDFDLDGARAVLDRMARSVRIGGEPVSSVVAQYATGLRSVPVRARTVDGRICLSRPPLPPPRCFVTPTGTQVRFSALGPGRAPALLGGVAGNAVFRVLVQRRSGPPLQYLPVPLGAGSLVKGWAVPALSSRVTRVTWYDADGRQLGELPAPDLPQNPSIPPGPPPA